MIKRLSSPRRLLFCGLCLLLTLLWLGFIFGNSLKDGADSSEQSRQVHEIVNDLLASLGLRISITEATLRKAAHFTEFFVLALLLCLDTVAFGAVTPRTSARRAWIPLCAIPACLLCALTDELLQTLSVGRAAQLSDVLLDTSGAALGALLFLGALLLLRKILTAKE